MVLHEILRQGASKLPKKVFFLSRIGAPNFQLPAVLMPREREVYSAPPLKALISI